MTGSCFGKNVDHCSIQSRTAFFHSLECRSPSGSISSQETLTDRGAHVKATKTSFSANLQKTRKPGCSLLRISKTASSTWSNRPICASRASNGSRQMIKCAPRTILWSVANNRAQRSPISSSSQGPTTARLWIEGVISTVRFLRSPGYGSSLWSCPSWTNLFHSSRIDI
jgi:hypothetical protein